MCDQQELIGFWWWSGSRYVRIKIRVRVGLQLPWRRFIILRVLLLLFVGIYFRIEEQRKTSVRMNFLLANYYHYHSFLFLFYQPIFCSTPGHRKRETCGIVG